jgi:hypothetical protein
MSENPYSDELPPEALETMGEVPAPDERNSASRRGQKAKKARLDEERAEAWRVWHAMLASPIGRREIWRLLNDAGTFKTAFACGPNGFPQPESTWFQAGIKDFGERFYRTLARDHRALVLQMHSEQDPAFREAEELAQKLAG